MRADIVRGESLMEIKVTSGNLDDVKRLLDDNRLEVLHCVHKHFPQGSNKMEIAKKLGRESSYKNVFYDIQLLLDYGLLVQDDDGKLVKPASADFSLHVNISKPLQRKKA